MPVRNQPQTTTATQLYDYPAGGYRYELISGHLTMMSPAGGRHGRIAHRVAILLSKHVDDNQLGIVFAAETGFLIQTDPDTVLAPDVAFVSRARFETVVQALRTRHTRVSAKHATVPTKNQARRTKNCLRSSLQSTLNVFPVNR